MPFDGKTYTPPEIEKLRALLATPEQWTKGMLCDQKRYCMVGAISVAVSGYAIPTRSVGRSNLYRAVAKAIQRRFGATASIEYINDRQATNHANILAFIDEAEAIMREWAVAR